MDTIQASVKKAARVYVHNMVRKEKTKWPPDCIGTFYQPKRPKVKTVPVNKH